MIQYLCWRVLTGRHTKITLSFLVVGHTKLVFCLAAVVEDSAECNYSQLTGNVDGTIIVPTFDWTSFFALHFKRILGIKMFHHFSFQASNPGIVILTSCSLSFPIS